jgi:hypothetical protein
MYSTLAPPVQGQGSDKNMFVVTAQATDDSSTNYATLCRSTVMLRQNVSVKRHVTTITTGQIISVGQNITIQGKMHALLRQDETSQVEVSLIGSKIL